MRHCRCAVWYCGVAVSLSRFLHTVHVDKGFAVQKQVTDGNKAVSLSKCGLNKCRKILLYLIAVVVAENDRTVRKLRKHGVKNRLRRTLRFPVNGVNIPLNDLVTRFTNGFNNSVVIFAVGCAEKLCSPADDGFKQIVELFICSGESLLMCGWVRE